ncbi:hypothetical protein PR202_gb01529 [Eleusine coracana subsp. coracana]|uniref:Uncharacterized protein n=1 Tax=Eleusine coracana subsp. coracana TaxID=191504 RepID=A0AAV5DWU9_ELECO|nr:hypothetical protein PR202_gb01529 [Eleusine coracana subsp. coracana]
MANKLTSWAIQEIEAIQRRFLWADNDSSVRGKCAVAWPTITMPKDLGGLGITNLRLAGIAMRTRWLWLQKTDQDHAWADLQLQVEPKVQALFNASVSVHIGDGQRTMFWTDRWINGKGVANLAPTLFQLIGTRNKRTLTVAEALQGRS